MVYDEDDVVEIDAIIQEARAEQTRWLELRDMAESELTRLQKRIEVLERMKEQ